MTSHIGIVSCAYNAQSDGELSVQQGERVNIIGNDESGWIFVERTDGNSEQGYIPKDYVQVDDDEVPIEIVDDIVDTTATATTTTASNGMKKRGNALETNLALLAPTPTGVESSVHYRRVSYDDRVAEKHLKDLSRRVTTTRFGMWASNMAVITSVGLVICAVGILWWACVLPDEFATGRHIFAGVYTLLLGPLVYAFERRYAHDRPLTRFPNRGIVYMLVSVPTFLSLPTLFGGACLLVVAGVQTFSWYVREEYVAKPQEKSYAGLSTVVAAICPCLTGGGVDFSAWWQKIRNEDRVGEVCFLSAYFLANVIIWIYYLAFWFDKIDKMAKPWTAWIPFAKAFGSCLDFNINLMLLPVARSLIRWLYDHSTADQSVTSRCLRQVLYFVPLDKSLEFHELIGWAVLVHSIGHTVAHLFNYVLRQGQVWDTFGIGIWLTGGLLWGVIVLMYGAVTKSVKMYQFELFYYTHHLFVLFFFLNFIHGKGWWGPNFWKWALFPCTVYTLERIYRYVNTRRPVTVLSVTNMKPNVFCVELAKSGALASYKEGQYVFLKCAHVSRTEWHPFTISSAPQEDSVTLHIRVMNDESSWTHRVQSYLNMMGKEQQAHIVFEQYNERGQRVSGKSMGPDGKALLQIYGPLAAPTQHMPEYSNVMIVTSGIGVTPLSAALHSITHYRWQYFMGRSYPDNAYFFWIVPHAQLIEFRWFIRKVKMAMDQVANLHAKQSQDMAHRHIEVHLFVTSFDGTTTYTGEHDEALSRNLNEEEDVAFWGMLPKEDQVQRVHTEWTEKDLYLAMRDIRVNESYPKVFGGNVFVYNGRPDWQSHFHKVHIEHPVNDVGVLFCGNRHIGNDLKKQCQVWTAKCENRRAFHLHQEKF